MQLRQIEIDFDIHQMIELERRGFEEKPYVALRRLLKLSDKVPAEIASKTMEGSNDNAVGTTGRPFIEDGVSIPHGSFARMAYGRGTQLYEGKFLDGKLVVNGISYSALSPAASALGITKTGDKTSLNGWIYWEAKFPGGNRWQKLSDLRDKARRK